MEIARRGFIISVVIGSAGCLGWGTDEEDPPVERNEQPTADFRFAYNGDAGELTIAHDGGETIQNENLSIVFPNDSVIERPFEDQIVRPGHEVTVSHSDLEDDGVVRLIWEGEGHSKTLDEWKY